VRDETLDQLAAMDEPVGGTPVDHSASDNEPAQPGLFARLFKAETGPGDVEAYLDHPLNFDKSLGLAQVIRGATGLFGELKLAVIDVAFGLLNWFRRRPGPPAPA
jgi:hypothetical protein